MINILKKYEYWIFLLLTILVCLTPLIWFKGYPISGEEFYAVNYARWGQIFANAWSPYYNFGEFSVLLPFKLQASFFEILSHIFANYVVLLQLWHVFIWTATGISYYIFLNKLFDSKIWKGYIFGAVVYYLYTPFFLNISPFLMPPHFLFIGLPLVLLWLYKIIPTKFISKRQLALLSLIFIAVSPVFVNFIYGITLVMLILIYFFVYALFYRSSYFKQFSNLILVSVFVFIGVAWWAAPFAWKVFMDIGAIKSTSEQFTAIYASHAYDVISGFGSWAYREMINGKNYSYFPYYPTYDGIPFIFIRFIPLGLIIFTLHKLKNEKDFDKKFIVFQVFLATSYFIFTFLSKGATGVGSAVYYFLYKNVPLFWVFREPYAKFMPLAIAATGPLIVYALYKIDTYFKSLSSRLKYICGILFILISFIFGYPYWLGKVVWRINDGSIRSYEIKTPDYFNRLSNEWKPLDGYYLEFPSYGHVDYYKWPSGFIGNPYLMFTSAKVINPVSGYILNPDTQHTVKMLYHSLLTNPNIFMQLMHRYNISGFVFQGDLINKGRIAQKDWFESSYKQLLRKDFGPISIYSTQNDNGTLVTMVPSSAILFAQYESPADLLLINNLLPSYYFKKSSLSEPSDVYVLKGKEEISTISSKKITFPISDVNVAKQLIYLDADKKYISKISTEKTNNFALDSNKFILGMDSCTSCENLTVNYSDYDLVNLPSAWEQLGPDNQISPLIAKDNLLLLDSANTRYVKRIEKYDIYGNYLLNLKAHRSGIDSQFKIDILAIDKKRSIIETLFSKEFYDFIDEISLDINPSETLPLVGDIDYYIAISPLTKNVSKRAPQNYLSNTQISLSKKINVNAVVLPKQFKNDIFKPNIFNESSLSYVTISNHFRIVTLENSKQKGVMLFKEAFNKNWRLIPITNAQLNRLNSKNFVTAGVQKFYLEVKALTGIAPSNIEYYSNGWDLTNINSEHLAIVFIPQSVSNIIIVLTSLILVGLLLPDLRRKHK